MQILRSHSNQSFGNRIGFSSCTLSKTAQFLSELVQIIYYHVIYMPMLTSNSAKDLVERESEYFRVSQCSLGCPGTHSVDQAGLELTKIRLPLPLECWD